MRGDSAWAEREALFVRIPAAQARAIDRLAFEQRRPKQEVVSDLLSRSIERDGRRVTIETSEDAGLVLGHHAFRPHEPDVLTLEEVAELLGVEPALIEQLARDGELPARLIGDTWRFARSAVLGWLARGSAGPAAIDR
ncbi:MAG: helix-turn-helix domain-containing protein [Solirubrobacteraceae bacterium]